jgi:hypothetical protein
MVILPCGCRYDIDSSFCPEGQRLYELAFYANYGLEHSVLKWSRTIEEERQAQEERDQKVKAWHAHMGWVQAE